MKFIVIAAALFGPCRPAERVTVAGECGKVVDSARPQTPADSWEVLVEMDDGSYVSTAVDWVKRGCDDNEK